MSLTYNDVSYLLHAAVGRLAPGEEASGCLLDTVAEVARPGCLAKLISAICADQTIVGVCAARSFRHPLGFKKLALIDALPLFMLRVHVWWPGDDIGVEHVHNHRFGFVSSVIRGGYDMELYQPDRTGTPMIEYEETVSPDLGWRLRHVGTAGLRPLATLRLRQGSSYAFSPETLHRVTVSQAAPCVTLFLQTAVSRRTTQVFASPGYSAPAGTPKVMLSGDAYRRELTTLLAGLVTPAA